MDWGSFVIGSGGLIVGGISTVLSYTSRRTSFQQMLRQRQFQSYEDLMDALFHLCRKTVFPVGQSAEVPDDGTLLTALKKRMESLRENTSSLAPESTGQRSDDSLLELAEERVKLYETVEEELLECVRVVAKCMIFLPRAVDEAVAKFIEDHDDFIACMGTASQKEAAGKVTSSLENVVEVIRRSLSVEPLTRGTIRLLGKAATRSVKESKVE